MAQVAVAVAEYPTAYLFWERALSSKSCCCGAASWPAMVLPLSSPLCPLRSPELAGGAGGGSAMSLDPQDSAAGG